MTILPFDDRDGWIWFDGKLVPWREARVHVLTHGLHYASCVFEGERAYNGKIFKCREHSERLHKSAALLEFTIPYSLEQLDAAKKEVLAKQNITNGYIRPVAWRGSEMMAISAWEWPSYFSKEAREKGLSLQTSSWARPAPNTAPIASKAAGLYMICTMSKHAAEKNGYNDALMLDYRGYIAEATGANLFFVFNGELHTPTPDCFLYGITRRTVMELARKAGITVVERHIKPEEIANASEMFLTGTAAEVTPIGKIDNFTRPVGPITKQLMQAYTELVMG